MPKFLIVDDSNMLRNMMKHALNEKGYSNITEALRKLPTYAKTPILALTTENKDDMKAKGKSVGATGWIVKPFVPEQLLKAVTIVLSR